MSFEKTVLVDAIGIEVNWWRVSEVRDVRQAEPGFSGTAGNLFVQIAGYVSSAAFDGGAAPVVSEAYRIRYGAGIVDPLPDRFRGVAVIRSDDVTLAAIEQALLEMPRFEGGSVL